MITNSMDIDDIYRQMALIRRDIHVAVSESVAGAEAVVDWGRYTWLYPWLALGAAGVASYSLFCGVDRQAPKETNPADKKAVSEPVAKDGRSRKSETPSAKNMLLAVGDIVLPVAITAGQNYMLRWLDQQYPTRKSSDVGSPSTVGKHAGHS